MWTIDFMGKFEKLILRSGHPAEVQETAHRELPALLEQSNLHIWKPGDPIRHQGIRFLIGVAVWSVYDMRLLDAVDQSLADGKRAEHVDVFDVDDCVSDVDQSSSVDCFEAYVPRIGTVLVTPVVSLWENGQQVNQGEGAFMRRKVAKHFGIDHDELVALPWIK